MTSAPLQIRDADAGDASRIAGLHVRSWRAAYAPFVPAAYLESLDQDAHRLSYWQPAFAHVEPGWRAWVAFWAGIPAGFASVAPRRPDALPTKEVPEGLGWLEHIHLAPELRGRGVGRPLFAHALAALRADGFTEAVLWVYRDNTPARRFYERAGWAPDGTEAVKQFRWTGSDGRPATADLTMVRYRGATEISSDRSAAP